MYTPRLAHADDSEPLAHLWYDGWIETHRRYVPTELTALRTLESFQNRLLRFGANLRTAGPIGAPLGLCAIRADELDQLFVAPEARGTGLAEKLLADGEERLAANGIRHPHLLCIIENTRAARFYERCGWINTGVSMEAVQSEDGPFPMQVFRFEKEL